MTPPPKWTVAETDKLWPEIRLFFRSFGHADWIKRCEEWETHVNVLAHLSDAKDDDWKAKRIKNLFQHLGILDTKFNVLLTVNTLLLVAFNGLLNFLLGRGHGSVPTKVEWGAVAFGVSWFVTTIVCLIGEQRLVWGDLGLIDTRRLSWNDFKKQPGEFKNAEDYHVRALVVAVARRTNKFRIGVMLTYVNVFLLGAVFIVGLWP